MTVDANSRGIAERKINGALENLKKKVVSETKSPYPASFDGVFGEQAKGFTRSEICDIFAAAR
jgi:hypothetical protein